MSEHLSQYLAVFVDNLASSDKCIKILEDVQTREKELDKEKLARIQSQVSFFFFIYIYSVLKFY